MNDQQQAPADKLMKAPRLSDYERGVMALRFGVFLPDLLAVNDEFRRGYESQMEQQNGQ